MSANVILFLIVPYVAAALFVVVTAYRAWYRPFTMSSLSSQLLESQKLYWGSLAFHWGIVLILLGHLGAFLFPRALVAWNSVPLRLVLLEITGVALALWTLGGLVILMVRRLDARVRVVTTPMDRVVLIVLLVSVVTGLLTATHYRFGSAWFPAVFAPYLWSLATLQPRPELVADLPWLVQLHAFNFFVLLALFPFSRLVHIVTLPLQYLVRPWQVVIWNRRSELVASVPGAARGEGARNE